MSGEAAFLEAFKRSSSSSSSSSSSDEDSSPKAKAKAKGRKVATKKTEKFDLFGDIFSASPSPKPSPGRKRKLIKPGQGGGGSKPPAGPVLVVSSDESDKENSEELDVFVTQPHKKKARAEIDLTLNSPKNMLDLTASVDSQSAKKSKWKKKIQVVGSEEEEEDEDEDKIKLDFSAEDTDDDYDGAEEEVDEVALLFQSCEDISKKMLAEVESAQLFTTSVNQSSKIDKAFAKSLFPGTLELKDYQLVGLNWLNLLYSQKLNGILADEMGLGKTVQAIALLALLKEKYGIRGPHLIVAPGSTLENWRRELFKWLPSHETVVYHGSQETRGDIRYRYQSLAPDIILTTYTYFERQSGSEDRSFLYKFRFAYVVYDEAHAIKNMNSQRYARLAKIRSENQLLLSGTPVQNNLSELLALMSFCMPKVFNASSQQLAEYFREERDGELERISNALKPFILRRLKADVLQQLSKKVETVKLLPLKEGRQRNAYNKLVEDYKERKAQKLSASDISNIFSHLRKAANHPLLVRDYFGSVVDGVDRSMPVVLDLLNRVAAFGPKATKRMISDEIKSYSDWDFHLLACEFASRSEKLSRMVLPKEALWNSAKCEQLRELLPALIKEDHRICLFSQWTTILDILEEVMRSLQLQYVRFDGQTDISGRQDIVDRFNGNPDIKVFLLSTRAGGLGINLTSADTVIIHDLDFNPTVDRQAEDRCHRIGQKKTVQVIKLVCKETVDEKILEMQRRKTQLDSQLLQAKPGSDKKEIQKILSSLA